MTDAQTTSQRIHHNKGKKWGKPFERGHSGNPVGKSKVAKNAMQEALEHAPDAMKTLVAVAKNQQVSAAARVAASIHILDRAYGRPPQLNTNVNMEYRRAIDMTDQELEAIIAGAFDPHNGAQQLELLPSPTGAASVGGNVGTSEQLEPEPNDINGLGDK